MPRLHSFLRKGTYASPTPPSTTNNIIVVTAIAGSESVWTMAEELEVLSPVYISGEDSVSLSKAESMDTMPCIGFVSALNGGSCTVRFNGELEGFTDLVPGGTYYISNEGGIEHILPDEEEGWPSNIQQIGKAKNPQTLLIEIGSPLPIQI